MEQFTSKRTKLFSHLDANVNPAKDQVQLGAACCSGLPVTYQPFKFENRRLRIDWRLLHGVDIHKVIRDTDLDTLERLVSCVTWGDIEAEDTRHLSESNFVKIFRLAQLLLEYLLYVQDNLKHTNSVLEQSRAAVLVHVQALSARCNELQGQLKLSKKELRSARKTVKTLELMAAAVQAGAIPPATAAAGANGAAPAGAAAAPNVSVNMQATLQDQLGQQGVAAGQQSGCMQQPHIQQTAMFDVTSAEVLLQTQLAELTDHMAVAGCELERLREEREELQYQVRYMYDMLAAKTGGEKTAQRHFSPARSGMYASRAPGSPYSWRRQYGEQYEAAATAEAEAAAAAAANEEVARRVVVIEQQHVVQMDQLKQQYEEQAQQHSVDMQQREQELQQRQRELQQCRQELHRCQQQMQQYNEQVHQLEMKLERCTLQLEQQRDENSELRQQLCEAVAAPKSVMLIPVVTSLRQQLDDKIRECTYLQGELNERETSIATFKQANENLEREIEELKNERIAPEAAAPSFVAKQRKSIALAETQAAKAQQQVTELMQENMELAQQVADLKARLAAAGGGGAAASAVTGDTVAAAEQLLSGRSSITSSSKGPAAANAAADKAWQQVAELKQDKLALTEQINELKATLAASVSNSPQEQQGKGTEWKLQEIVRLQNENRLLQQKVTSLQQRCAELERENALLERQAVKARNLGLAASLEASASSTPGSGLAAAIAAGGNNSSPSGRGSWARGSSASVGSSGPRAELTAADLAAGGMVIGPGGDGSRPGSAQPQQQGRGDDTDVDSDEPGEHVRSVVVRPAAPAKQQKVGSSIEFRSSVAAGKPDQSWIKKAVDEDPLDSHPEPGDRIAAYRPDEDTPQQQQQQQQLALLPPPTAAAEVNTTAPAAQPAATAAAQATAAPAHAGQLSQEAAAQLKVRIAEIAATPPEQLEQEYKDMCDDWDLPFQLQPEEQELFQGLLPHEVPGRLGLLTAVPHSADEYAAHQSRLLAQVNKQLDAELASYGIHPGRTGLSHMEFLAAMRMLTDRRAVWENQLSQEQRQQADVVRCGIIVHPYHVSQALLQQQADGPDGKKHWPGVRPTLVSAVRPPASMLPAGPAAIRTVAVRAMPGGQMDASVSPAAGVHQQVDNPSGVDLAQPYHSTAAAPSNPSGTAGPLAAALSGPPSAAKTAAIAAAMQLAGRDPPYSTSAHRAEAASGHSSPDLSPRSSPGPTGFSPMSAALQRRASLQSQQSLQSQPSQAGYSPSARSPVPATAAVYETSSRPGSAPGQPSGSTAPAVDTTHSSRPATADNSYQQSSAPGPSRFGAGGGPGSPAASAGVYRQGPAGNPAGSPQRQARNVSPGIAAAMKQYMDNSFDESDEF